MKQLNGAIEDQYYKPDLFEDIFERLQEQGVNTTNISRTDIAGVDEFHVRGAEVSKELAKEFNLTNANVLDVGCGIGGPSRMLADEFNCNVTGVDISFEFIRTAYKLTELVGLEEKTRYIQADAIDLPFDDGTFDVVWTQHVQMNIKDKVKFYSEINRVLSKKGILIYYDIFKKNGKDVNYPVPWADDASVSFLGPIKAMNKILKKLKFTELQTTDQTSQATLFLTNLVEKMKKNGQPKLGLNVLMGDSTKEKLTNTLNGINEDRIELQSGIYQRKN